MNYCQIPCEGCPVAKIEDPIRRRKAASHIGKVFGYYQHQELRTADAVGMKANLIKGANSNYVEDIQEHVVDPELDYDLVEEAVMLIANEQCPLHAY